MKSATLHHAFIRTVFYNDEKFLLVLPSSLQTDPVPRLLWGVDGSHAHRPCTHACSLPLPRKRLYHYLHTCLARRPVVSSHTHTAPRRAHAYAARLAGGRIVVAGRRIAVGCYPRFRCTTPPSIDIRRVSLPTDLLRPCTPFAKILTTTPPPPHRFAAQRLYRRRRIFYLPTRGYLCALLPIYRFRTLIFPFCRALNVCRCCVSRCCGAPPRAQAVGIAGVSSPQTRILRALSLRYMVGVLPDRGLRWCDALPSYATGPWQPGAPGVTDAILPAASLDVWFVGILFSSAPACARRRRTPRGYALPLCVPRRLPRHPYYCLLPRTTPTTLPEPDGSAPLPLFRCLPCACAHRRHIAPRCMCGW